MSKSDKERVNKSKLNKLQKEILRTSITPAEVVREVSEEIVIPHNMVIELYKHKKRTGLSPSELLSRKKKLPDGLDIPEIDKWADIRIKSKIYARKDDIQCLLSCYRKEPSKKNLVTVSSCGKEVIKKALVIVSKEYISELREHIKRTQIGATKFMRIVHNPPANLNAQTIGLWKNNRKKQGCPEMLEFVINAYRSFPDCTVITNSAILHTDELREKIPKTSLEKLRLYQDTIKSLPHIIFKNSDDCPVDLSKNMVRDWLSGSTSYARPAHVDWVLLECRKTVDTAASLPHKHEIQTEFPSKPQRYNHRKPIDLYSWALLNHYRETLGLLPGFIFKNATNIPNGLNEYMVSNWLNKNSSTANSEYLDWVLQRCEDILNEALAIDPDV